ncbi:MAG TPA: CHASE3 domain-containing protein, partial [Blastocatellia bacterium]|nr:CHASE3 domain-containing protein [Blastocatellia bacterium]
MKRPHEPKIAAAAGLVLLVLIVNAVLSYRATTRVIHDVDEVSRTREALMELEVTRSVLTDAEAAERGYLISGKEADLESYWSDVEEIDGRLNRLEAVVSPVRQRGMPALRAVVSNNLETLEQEIGLRRRLGPGSAARVAVSDRSRRGLDQPGRIIGRMEADEQGVLFQETRRAMASGRAAILSLSADKVFAITFLSLVYLVAIRLLGERKRNEARIRQQREWFRVTLSSIGDGVIATDMPGLITFMNSVAHT